jgi:small subunit ribosomal protein S4e
MAHLKRLAMPEMWPLPRKQKTFVVTPLPGPHPRSSCLPLAVILRDILKFARSAAEAKKTLAAGKVLVDKKARKEPGFPAGLMDVIELPEIGQHYRIDIGMRGLFLRPISAQEAGRKLCRIRDKRVVRKGAVQLSLHDGRTIIMEQSKAKDYAPGDSLVIQLPEQAVAKAYALAKGSPAVVFSGRNRGVRGTVKAITPKKTMLGRSMVVIRTKDGREIETLKDYVMVGEI